MWWNGWKQLWEPVWLEWLGWAPHPALHWSPSDCPSMGRGGDGAPGRLAWAATDREAGGSVSGGGPPSEMEASSQSRPPPQKTFFFSPKRMCNYTPNCPAPPSNERSHNTWYLQVGRHKGGLRNDRAPRPQGPLEETSIQLWPPTSIKDRLIICFGEKGLFIQWKLIVLPHHCSSSKAVLQSTKDAELELK